MKEQAHGQLERRGGCGGGARAGGDGPNRGVADQPPKKGGPPMTRTNMTEATMTPKTMTQTTTTSPMTPAERSRKTTRALTALAEARRRPECQPEWIVGACPRCGAPLVENSYYCGGAGYRTFRECWESLGGSCDYRALRDMASAEYEAAESALGRFTVRVTSDFMNFYQGGQLIGAVDKRTFWPDADRQAVPTASFTPDIPAHVFERAALLRMERARATQKNSLHKKEVAA